PIGCAVDFVCRLLHLKIISLKKPLQIGLCNKAIGNYKSNGIEEKKPYYISISREGIFNEPGVVMQTLNFCIKDHNIFFSEGNEESFIRECIN
ncbi:hypothetical protein NYZ48_16620, partial [Acinetobacter baumannii]|nr:hypothetical protein [Acinetobacter baumannii]